MQVKTLKMQDTIELLGGQFIYIG